jgi:xanthine dehydrogenase large subunit
MVEMNDGRIVRIDENRRGLSPFVAGTTAEVVAEQKGTVPLSAGGSWIATSPDDVRFADGAVFDNRDPRRCIAWRDLVRKTYLERINLGERGFYATPGIDFNREAGRGHPFLYFTNGAAVAEVRIDRLTGELSVERVDLLIDAGVPINPGIDRGQIVGGFVQGMGWVTTEELKYDAEGRLLSHSPTTYKIPGVRDLPRVFNVDFLPNTENVVSLKRSKAVGEPPLLLGISVWAAVKNALSYVSGSAPPELNLPATGEEILLRLAGCRTALPSRPDGSGEPSYAHVSSDSNLAPASDGP